MKILRLLWEMILPWEIVWPHRSRNHFEHWLAPGWIQHKRIHEGDL